LTRNRLEGPPFQQVAVATSETRQIPCGVIFRSVGNRGVPIPGVAFDERSGTIPNAKGRCLDSSRPIPGLYVTGWLKRGPTGIIGTNRADSVETVAAVLKDLESGAVSSKSGVRGLALAGSGLRITSYDEWSTIDLAERARGEAKGKPREKFTKICEMLECLQH
jgi:ferredoxin/flavodoxin---NADP+ reductase